MLPTIPCTDFLHLVIPECEACPDPVAAYMVRQAAIQFAEISKTWRHTGSMAIAANNETLVAPDHTAIHTIEEATLNGQPLTPVAFLASEPTQLTGASPTGAAAEITQVEPDKVQLNPFQAGTLRYAITLKPTRARLLGTFPGDPLRDAHDVLPAYMFNQHAQTIAWGALAKILMLPKQPFSDPQRAQMYAASFNTACSDAQADARMGQQRAPRRNRIHWD